MHNKSPVKGTRRTIKDTQTPTVIERVTERCGIRTPQERRTEKNDRQKEKEEKEIERERERERETDTWREEREGRSTQMNRGNIDARHIERDVERENRA